MYYYNLLVLTIRKIREKNLTNLVCTQVLCKAFVAYRKVSSADLQFQIFDRQTLLLQDR